VNNHAFSSVYKSALIGCDRDLRLGFLYEFNPFTLSDRVSDCIEGYFRVSASDTMLRYFRCGEHSALVGLLILLLKIFTHFVETHLRLFLDLTFTPVIGVQYIIKIFGEPGLRFLKHKTQLMIIAATVVIAVGLAVFPISGTPHSGMIKVSGDLFAGNRNLIPINRAYSIENILNGKNDFKNTLDTITLDTLWTGSIPLTIQSGETITNVMLAANSIDLTSLNPGEEFSFNNIVGLRTEEKGYKEGLMYTNGEVVSGVGGGICIVSTILYNAALETGLKILERHPHSGPVSYAEPGRDAAVSYGWADLRFKNDTGHPIVIKSKVENNELLVSVFGVKKPNQTIIITAKDYEELPYKIEEIEDETVPDGQVVVDQKARPGYAVTIVRSFMENGKLIKEETISKDIMLPQDKKIRVPYVPLSIPTNLPTLPGFPSEHPDSSNSATSAAAPDQKSTVAPKSGSFTVPDNAKPAPKPSQPERLPDSSGSAPLPNAATDGRNLSNSDRTTPTASE